MSRTPNAISLRGIPGLGVVRGGDPNTQLTHLSQVSICAHVSRRAHTSRGGWHFSGKLAATRPVCRPQEASAPHPPKPQGQGETISGAVMFS